jgi:hypothetical protein
LNSSVVVHIITDVNQRLTALLAAILMVAPACWTCPMMAAEKADAASHRSCCCESNNQDASAPFQKPDHSKPCPCEMSQAPRDFAMDVQVVPTVSASLDHLLLSPSEIRFAWVTLLLDRGEIFNDTGPPPVARALFERHNAWLL